MNGGKFNIEHIECEGFVCGFQNVEDFRIAFKKEFKHIVAFHATNLSDEELISIQTEGLKIASKELLEKKAKHRFVVHQSEELTKEIEKDISDWFSTEDLHENKFYTKNEINFGLLKDGLFENYHYLLFGAESLLPVADYLRKRYYKSFRRILVNSGLHYMIEVLIPVIKTDDIWIDNIYDYFTDGCPEVNLVYYSNLSYKNIVNIERVDRPIDRQKLILI
ncbi:hypothetical protein HNQ02_001868 [Flavobacterium sp. 7E]|uniref:hypothetical protein n=1 Tax=Flavobacterium sp. 7E TaxID=2735898 RepID=UPI00156E5476|nr:hypothetical protein [Flavobacterium sp. 7E]NRS88948.1 hypothetical protein [Flavobacterium sp. 7E]